MENPMPQHGIARGRIPNASVRVTLPSTEICMHLIAGQQRRAAKVGEDASEIYDETVEL
jgi:hypothetical protein